MWGLSCEQRESARDKERALLSVCERERKRVREGASERARERKGERERDTEREVMPVGHLEKCVMSWATAWSMPIHTSTKRFLSDARHFSVTSSVETSLCPYGTTIGSLDYLLPVYSRNRFGVRCESGPLRAVHLSRHKWPGGLGTFTQPRASAVLSRCVGGPTFDGRCHDPLDAWGRHQRLADF